MSSVSQNLKLARRKKRLSQAELSELCGWSNYPSRISNYELGIREPKSDDLIKLARALNVSVDWLYRDYGSNQPIEVRQSVASYKFIKYIPLLSWNQIAAHMQGSPVHIKDMLVSSHTTGNKSFALVVQDDCMEATQGESFFAGSIIFIDDDLKAKSGDYVIALIKGNATFKQLIIDCDQSFLKPLNPRYPILKMPEEGKIIGVVRVSMKIIIP